VICVKLIIIESSDDKTIEGIKLESLGIIVFFSLVSNKIHYLSEKYLAMMDSKILQMGCLILLNFLTLVSELEIEYFVL